MCERVLLTKKKLQFLVGQQKNMRCLFWFSFLTSRIMHLALCVGHAWFITLAVPAAGACDAWLIVLDGLPLTCDALGALACPTPGDALPTLGDALPTPGDALPTLGAALPTPGAALPTLGAALPTPGDALPIPGDALPTPGDALPTPGDALPTPGDALPTPGDPWVKLFDT